MHTPVSAGCYESEAMTIYSADNCLPHMLQKYTSLVYLITLPGCSGTTDDFAATHSRLKLSSAALAELAKSIPVHSLILSDKISSFSVKEH